MKISHEVPLSYLKPSREFNDYDYALSHLFDQSEEYVKFFEESSRIGREIIIDNSAYEISIDPELQKLYPDGFYDMESYAYWINRIRPTWYVLPDVKSNPNLTTELADYFKKNFPETRCSRSIGVVHGDSLEEMQKCYNELHSRADKLAFSFENWWFDYAKERDIHIALIRPVILSKLNIDYSKPHHLLGCILPQEFELYRHNQSWIDSIDTSAPVTNALENIIMSDWMTSKPETTIIGAFYRPFDQITLNIMRQNVETFRQYLNKI